MSIINSVSSSWLPQVASNSIPKSQLGSFEMNSKEFGPVAAGALGVAQAAGDAGTTLYSFSSQSLEQLSRVTQQAISSVGDAVDEVADLAMDGVESVGATLEEVVDLARETGSEVVDGIGNALSSTASTLGEVGSGMAGYAALGVAAGRRLVNELV